MALAKKCDVKAKFTAGGIVNLTIDGQTEPAKPSCLCAHRFLPDLKGLGRHLMQAVNHRILRTQAFQSWQEAVCA